MGLLGCCCVRNFILPMAVTLVRDVMSVPGHLVAVDSCGRCRNMLYRTVRAP